MPVTLRSVPMRYKNPRTGDYVPFNSIKGEPGRDSVAAELGSRVTALNNSEFVIGSVVEVIGIPVYISNAEFANYPGYSISTPGWYVFARVTPPEGSTVRNAVVSGAAGFIISAAEGYIDLAVRFEVAAQSSTVTITYADQQTETFVFRAVDLAISNLDYRTSAIGTVPSGKTVQGQIADNASDIVDLKSAIKEVGKGFSSSSASLLKTILNSIVYTSDQSQNIDDLYNAIIQTKTVQLVPIKSNTPNETTFVYEPKSWQSALVWEPDYTITGGVMTVTFDDEVVTNFDIQVFILDASKQPYKYAGYKNPENINVQGEWTPYLFNPGASAGFGKAAKTFSLSIPEGCYAFFCVRWNGTVYGGSEITSAGEAANWVINDDGITVVISGGVEA